MHRVPGFAERLNLGNLELCFAGQASQIGRSPSVDMDSAGAVTGSAKLQSEPGRRE